MTTKQVSIGLNNALLSLLIVSFLAVNGYWAAKLSSMEAEIVNLRISIASIDADRFTSEDGLAVWKEISSIKQDISMLSERIESFKDGDRS